MLDTLILRILLILSIYLPFEDFILKWLPVSPTVYLLVLRQIPDAIIITLFLLIVLIRQRIKTFSNFAFAFLCLFVIYSFLLHKSYQTSFVESIVNIKAILRYIFIIFILLNLKVSTFKLQRYYLYTINSIIYIAFLQIIISYLQLIGGNNVKDFFKPRNDVISTQIVTGFSFTAFQETWEVFGTMPDHLNYGLFLSVAFAPFLLKNINENTKIFLAFLFWGSGIFISGSRMALIMLIIVTLAVLFHKRKIKLLSIFIILTVLSTIISVFIWRLHTVLYSNKNFWFIFTKDYWTIFMEVQRGAFITNVFSGIINDIKILFFGLSPDQKFVLNYIYENYYKTPLTTVEDVYWIAFILYYGLIGSLFFVLFWSLVIFKIRKLSKRKNISKDFELKDLQIIIYSLTICAILGNFVNQILEVRHFSFYYWLFIGYYFSIMFKLRVKNENLAYK